MKMNTYDVEVTDTFGGEANYSWAQRFRVHAQSMRGAITKVSRYMGTQGRLRKVMDTGDLVRHDVQGAAVCVFTMGYNEQDPLFRRAVQL